MVKLLMNDEITPNKLFSERSNIWIELRWHRFKGILLLNSFDFKLRSCKFYAKGLSSIHVGMLPFKLLCLISNKTNLVLLFKDDKRLPNKLLFLKHRVLILESF